MTGVSAAARLEETPLAGARVLDFTTAGAGPKATSQLGALGADVLKLEPVSGNLTSRMPPFQGGIGSFYTAVMANKRSAFFNPATAGPDLRTEMLTWADAFAHNLRPGSIDKLGFDYEQCRAINPGLIYVEISAWGTSGPLRQLSGVDPITQSYTGWASYTGEDAGQPELNRAYGYIDHMAGSFAAAAVMLGLWHRHYTGEGSYLRVSLMGSSMWTQMHQITETIVSGRVPRPLGSAGTMFAPDCVIRCGDGQDVAITVRTDGEWAALCRALARPDLLADQRFSDNRSRLVHRALLQDLLAESMADASAFWWVLQFSRAGVPHALAQKVPQLLSDPQILENGYLEIEDAPSRGVFRLPASPWQFSRSRLHAEPPPVPGQHTAELATILSAAREPRPSAARAVPADGGWLAGLNVIDTTQGIAGPLAASLLAAFGAQVVKVEPPAGDYARRAGEPIEPGGPGIPYLAFNTAKSVTGRLPALSDADILLVDQDSDWLDLDPEEASAAHPRLIVCVVSANGRKGPRGHVRGGELTAQVQAEYHASLGRPGHPVVRSGPDVASASAAVAAFQAVLAALCERIASNAGQVVDVSVLGAALFCRKNVWSVLGEPDAWVGHLCHGYSDPPDHAYLAADGSVLINLFRTTEEQYVQLLSALGLLDTALGDERFDLAGGGRAAVGNGRYATALRATWSEAFSRFTTAELVELVNGLGGLASPVHDLAQLIASPQFAAVDMVRTVHSDGTAIPVIVPPIDGAGLGPAFAGQGGES